VRYQMKQKLISFGDDFTITDDSGRKVASVDGKVLALRNKLELLDPSGQQLAMIKEHFIAPLRPVYDIERDGKTLATVKKDLFTVFRASFTVDVPGPDDLEAQGSFLDFDYTFKRGRKTVATVSKKFFSFTDSYGVDVEDGEDWVLILASTIVIDMCCHDKPSA
jgi:uncharacterized protein YxjI